MRLASVIAIGTAAAQFAASALLATTVLAASSKDRADCKPSADPDLRIAACTRLLGGRIDAHDRIAILNDRGRGWASKDDFGRAEADYNEAIRIDPTWSGMAAVYQNRGNISFWRRDFERAIADYSEAIRVDPKYSYAYQARGQMWLNKGDADRAIADFNEVIRTAPEYAEGYSSAPRFGATSVGPLPTKARQSKSPRRTPPTPTPTWQRPMHMPVAANTGG